MAKKWQLLKHLYRVDLDTTGLCNRTCHFCPRTYKSYPNVNEHMSWETLDIVLNELRSVNFKGVIELAGRGEPTLHPHFEELVDRVIDGPWFVRVTTNGYKIEKYWNTVYSKIDELILNTYTNREEFEERVNKYVALPHNGSKVDHYFKPDTYSVEEINALPSQKDYRAKDDAAAFRYAFNNRAGTFSNNRVDGKCWHPMRQIFINYHGDYQMCCNDWKYQITIGNVHERSLMHMYHFDEKLNRIRWSLLHGQRQDILPCSTCDDIQGTRAGSVRVMNDFMQTDEYKFLVCPQAAKATPEQRKSLRGMDLIPVFEESDTFI